MSDANIIYSYGGAESLAAAFNGIAIFFQDFGQPSGILTYPVAITLLLFGLYALIATIMKNDILLPIKWFGWVWIATILIFYPKCDVIVSDKTTKNEYTVSNVPYLLGTFASIFSRAEVFITEKLQLVLQVPDRGTPQIESSLSYGNSGIAFGSKALKQINSLRITDGNLIENMGRFINNCVVLQAHFGRQYTIEDLKISTDIWELVKNSAHNTLGFDYRVQNEGALGSHTKGVTCYQGAQLMDAELLKHAKGKISLLAKKSGWYKDKYNKALRAALTHMFLKTATHQFADFSEKIIRQQMMINALSDMSIQNAESAGSPKSYALARAMIHQKAWYQVMGELASEMVMIVKIVIETLVYLSFILVAVLCFTPGGIQILYRYLGILLWVQTWPFVYELFNFVANVTAQYRTTILLDGEIGLTHNNSLALADMHGLVSAVASGMAIFVPVFSLMLLKMSASAFVHIAGGILGGSQGAASRMASVMEDGNISHGSVQHNVRSSDITNAFKHDTNLSHRGGAIENQNQDGSISTGFASGNNLVIKTDGAMSRWGEGIDLQKGISDTIQQGISKDQSEVSRLSHSYNTQEVSAKDQASKVLQSMMKSVGQNQDWSIDENTDTGRAIQKTMAFTKSLKENLGLTDAQSAELAGSLGANIPFTKIGASKNFSSRASFEEAYNKGKELMESQNLTDSIHQGVRHLNSVKFGKSMNESKQLAEDSVYSYRKADSINDEMNRTIQSLDRWNMAKNRFEQTGLSRNKNLGQEFVNWYGEKLAKPDDKGDIAAEGRYQGANKALKSIQLMDDGYNEHMQKFINEKINDELKPAGNYKDNIEFKNEVVANQLRGNIPPPVNLEDEAQTKSFASSNQSIDEARLLTNESNLKTKLPTGQIVKKPITNLSDLTESEFTPTKDSSNEKGYVISKTIDDANKNMQNYTKEGDKEPTNIVEEFKTGTQTATQNIKGQNDVMKKQQGNLAENFEKQEDKSLIARATAKPAESALGLTKKVTEGLSNLPLKPDAKESIQAFDQKVGEAKEVLHNYNAPNTTSDEKFTNIPEQKLQEPNPSVIDPNPEAKKDATNNNNSQIEQKTSDLENKQKILEENLKNQQEQSNQDNKVGDNFSEEKLQPEKAADKKIIKQNIQNPIDANNLEATGKKPEEKKQNTQSQTTQSKPMPQNNVKKDD